MMIQLPPHIEDSIHAAVHSGRYASLDAAMTEAATLLVQRLEEEHAQTKPAEAATAVPFDPLLGIWRDAPDEIDEIVAEAMQRRREEPLRAMAGE